MRLIVSLCLLVLISPVGFAQERRRSPRIDTQVIGAFPGYVAAIPRAINNKGEVVGSAATQEVVDVGGTSEIRWRSDAFFWSRKTGFVILARDALGTDINERGDVTISQSLCSWGTCRYVRGSVWNVRTGFKDLGDISPTAINNSGDVAGICSDGDPVWGQRTACAIRGGVFEEWACPFDANYYYCDQSATDINERGDVVANRVIDFEEVGTRLFSRHGENVHLADGSYGIAINNRGVIAGIAGGHASLLINGAWRRLPGGAHSGVRAVNARGWVVGHLPSLAIVWTGLEAEPIYLAQTESHAFDVNDRGQIVGIVGVYPAWRMVIWTVR